MTARKIATSIPEEQYRALERARRSLKLNRSEAVQRAIDVWLAAQRDDARVEQYIRAYLAKPEDAAEGDAYVQAWASDLSPEESW
jgi:metal-responsive CopG/Arc/MetJ family transcriptional regulator